MVSSSRPYVVVAGAGPSGLLLALLLARKGIAVTILDLSDQADERPRATHYGSPAMYELERAGVADEVREQGFIPRGVCWRKLDGTPIAGLDATVLSDYPYQMTCLPLNLLSKIILSHLQEIPHATILWSHKVLSVGQDSDYAWVDCEKTTTGEKTQLKARYVVGCDGANSQVRRSLFGDLSFPGRTWNEQIVATNIYYDFYKHGIDDANFYIHPEHWFMASRITNDGLWRVTYGDIPGLSMEELRERLPTKFEVMLPGHPKPEQYKVANFSPYKVHQRLAPKMRVGRICLAADAAHLCNPFGGLGLTGGMVDVGGLYDCIAGLYDGKAEDSILDKYDEVRRHIYTAIVDPVSSENFRRVFDQDPEKALDTDMFLQQCVKAKTDVEFSRQFQLGSMAIQHDFTQYYNQAKEFKNGTTTSEASEKAFSNGTKLAVSAGGVMG